MIKVIKEYSFTDLLNNSWSGAVDTLKTISNNDKENELMDFLNEIYAEKLPTDTELNDLLWFDNDMLFEYLDIKEELL